MEVGVVAVDVDTLPKFHEFFVPALRVLASRDAAAARELVETISDDLGLSEEQRTQRLASGQRRLDNRVAWAVSYLAHAGAVEKPRRGFSQITERGRRLLRDHPHGFDVDTLLQFPQFVEFKARSGTRTTVRERAATVAVESDDEETPLERVAAAVRQLDSSTGADLVERLRSQPPEFLEKAVLELLVAMGYGGSADAAQHLGGPGDGGFDGVINQDRLGLGRIYVQAKRYGVDNIVGRPAVQAFLGALHHAGAAGGVFITTSRFSPDATEFARSITPRVILIDGSRLGQLMVAYRVGVQVRQTFTVVELDEDFFESL